jgi:hypothetical protein
LHTVALAHDAGHAGERVEGIDWRRAEGKLSSQREAGGMDGELKQLKPTLQRSCNLDSSPKGRSLANSER